MFCNASLDVQIKELTLSVRRYLPQVKGCVAFHDALPYAREPFQTTNKQTLKLNFSIVQNLQDIKIQFSNILSYIQKMNVNFYATRSRFSTAALEKGVQERDRVQTLSEKALYETTRENNIEQSALIKLPQDVIDQVLAYLPPGLQMRCMQLCTHYASMPRFWRTITEQMQKLNQQIENETTIFGENSAKCAALYQFHLKEKKNAYGWDAFQKKQTAKEYLRYIYASQSCLSQETDNHVLDFIAPPLRQIILYYRQQEVIYPEDCVKVLDTMQKLRIAHKRIAEANYHINILREEAKPFCHL